MLRLLFVTIIFSSIITYAQTSDSLIGNWKFKDVYNAEKLDSVKRATLTIFFGDMTIHLKADKHYTAFLMKKEEGTWAYDADLKQLILNNGKGLDQINIIKVTDKFLVLEMDKGKALVLEKKLAE